MYNKILKKILGLTEYSEQKLKRDLYFYFTIGIINYIFLFLPSWSVVRLLQVWNFVFFMYTGLSCLLAIGYKRYKKNEDFF